MFTAEIITIGDEILIGQIVDTNSTYIATELNKNGIKVRKITSIQDNAEEIVKAVEEAQNKSEIIIITGGLGPTNDDITKKTLTRFFNSQLVMHQPTLEFIEQRFAKRGIAMSDLNRKQAEVPQCCTVIPNENGTAPGMWFENIVMVNGKPHLKTIVSMPGVPAEMRLMLPKIIKELKQMLPLPQIFHKTMLTYGIPESALAEKIENWENALPQDMSLAYLPNIETGVKLRLSLYSSDNNGGNLIDKQFAQLHQLLGNSIYGYEPDSLEAVVGKLLMEKGATMATAESCTGGRIAHKITSVPGSSEYFKGGVVAYSNEVKANILGVNIHDIEKYGAVSSEVAQQMAEGARKILNADYAIATTGVAGPTGGTKEKPVGLCWFGIATPQGTKTFSQNFISDRLGNIASASSVALNALRLSLLMGN